MHHLVRTCRRLNRTETKMQVRRTLIASSSTFASFACIPYRGNYLLPFYLCRVSTFIISFLITTFFLNISVNGKPYKVTAFFPLYIWLNLSTSAISILDISTCNKFSEWIVSMKDKAFKYIYDKCGQNKPPKTTMNYTQLLVINRTIPSHVYLRSSHEQLSCTHSKQTLWMPVLLKEGILEPENCVTRRLN